MQAIFQRAHLRHGFLFWGLLCAFGLFGLQPAKPAHASEWPAWESFKAAFVSSDGRVVDHNQADLRTVSEGQAYGLLFALLAKDKPAFDLMLKWTENNLCQGSFEKHLPAWHWGNTDGKWGVIDDNSASDADVWLAYVLLEASIIWNQPSYAQKARAIGQLILQHETLHVESLGLSLLPGKKGFVDAQGTVRLNPSYVPPFLMARLANAWHDDVRWAQLYLSSQALLLRVAQHGFFPDWVAFRDGIMHWLGEPSRGDFDAIRVYTWLGVAGFYDASMPAILRHTQKLLSVVRGQGFMPVWLEPANGSYANQAGPIGFHVAIAPWLSAMNEPALALRFRNMAPNRGSVQEWRDFGYYNACLSLFGQAIFDRRLRTDATGQLRLGKETKSDGK